MQNELGASYHGSLQHLLQSRARRVFRQYYYTTSYVLYVHSFGGESKVLNGGMPKILGFTPELHGLLPLLVVVPSVSSQYYVITDPISYSEYAGIHNYEANIPIRHVEYSSI